MLATRQEENLDEGSGAEKNEQEEAESLEIDDSAQNGRKAESLAAQIKQLELELHGLRKELYFHLREEPPVALSSGDKSAEADTLSLDLNVQKQLLMLTQAMPQMVWIADSEGRVFHANERFYELTGVARDSDDGWSWINFLHPGDLEKTITAGNQASRENRPFSLELRHKDARGGYQWHLLHCTPFYDPDSNLVKWFGTTTNIHEQKMAQERLAESEAQLSTLADAIPHIVFAANPDGSIHFWNHRWFEYTGLTAQQSLSEAWTLLIHPQDRNGYLQDWKRALESGDTFECEFRLSRALGVNSASPPTYLWHLARAVAMRDSEDHIVRWFGTWTEIEGQKRN